MSYKMFLNITIILILICGLANNCDSQTKQYLNQNEIRTVIDTCIHAFKTYYIYPDAVPKIEKHINNQIKNGQYSNIEDLLVLTKRLRKDFRDATHDHHIWIDTMENLLIQDKPVSMEEIIKEKSKNNFGFFESKVLDENIGYLRIDSFDNLEYARETAANAIEKLADSKSIILDLRNNHGGHQNMVTFISSYFFEESMQLNSLYFRAADSLAEYWTNPLVPGKKLLNQQVFILTSKNTASAAESFTYSMKHYKRAIIVGESTRGAAHWKETYKFPSLGIFAEIPVARPINPVTKKDWESEGVEPDIEISADEAFDKAVRIALNK
jgi:C-terminal processing protease CtpA/Prc